MQHDRTGAFGRPFFCTPLERPDCDIIRRRRDSLRTQLVAVFVAVLLVAPLARSQEANVTLYGRLNIDMEVVNGRQTGAGCPDQCPNPNVFRVTSNSSLFGIRGVGPLGGGVSAIFQIENSISMTEGRGVLAGRESYVGLYGSLGTFKMGYFLSPYDDILPIFGNVPTLTSSILSTASLWAQGFLGPPESGGFDDRLRNSIRYDTPVISGLNASFQYSTNDGSPDPGSGSLGTGVFYANGPLQLGFAYELHSKIRGTPDAPLTDHAYSIAAGYQFPLLRVGAVYERLKYDATTTTRLKRNFYGIGATVDVGPGLIYTFVGRAGNGTGSAEGGTRIGGLAKGESTGSTQWEVSYTYVLSGRTLVYAGYVKIQNESNASYTFNSNQYPIVCDAYPNGGCGKPGGFVMGMAHFF
jgi:predicted porin